MFFNFAVFLFLIFIKPSQELDCTDITVNPIQPIGCDFIDRNLDLAALNPTQEELLKFSNITEITGDLIVGVIGSHSRHLKNFQGLNSLRTIKSLACYGNPVIESFAGLDNLTTITALTMIVSSTALSNLYGLGSVQTNAQLMVSTNGLDCDNVCNQKISHHLRTASTSVTVDECSITSFTCPSSSSTVETQISNCGVQSECLICNEVDCNFVMYRRCRDGNLHPEEECDSSTEPTTFNSEEITSSTTAAAITGSTEALTSSSSSNEPLTSSSSSTELLSSSSSSTELLSSRSSATGSLTSSPTSSSTGPATSSSTEPLTSSSSFSSTGPVITSSTESLTSSPTSSSTGPATSSSTEPLTSSSSFSSTGPVISSSIEPSSTISSAEVPTFSSTSNSTIEPTSRSNLNDTSSFNGSSVTNLSSAIEATSEHGFDCGLYSCEISIEEDIEIFIVDDLNLNSNLILLNNQQIRIIFGNFTLNGFNLSLSASSFIKIENGCLDAKHSTLNLDLTGMEITPEEKSLEIIEYKCITSKFEQIEVSSKSGVCLAEEEEVYTATQYSVLIAQDSYCVGGSFRLSIYQSIYIIMFVFIMLF